MTRSVPARISHVEWCCTDLERSRAFLERLFGWEFEHFGRHYLLHTPAAGTCVGLLQVDRVAPGASPLAFVEVTDIDATLDIAVEAGATVMEKRTPISGYGWYAKLLDPDDNIIGLFQSDIA